MNPSPIKVARSINGQGPKRPSTEAGGSKDKKLKSGNDTPQESENEDGFDTEESEEEQEADPEGEPEGEPEEDYGGLLIKGRVLDDMMSFADRVGHYFNRESMTWTKKKAPIVCSHNGKRFMRRVEAIQKAYKTLRNAINAEDVQGSKEARHSVADLVQELQTESQSILTTRLGNPSHGIEFFDVHKTQTMLQDVYFHIIPGLLKVLKVATDVYPPKRSMKQSALRHLSVFTTMLEDLATAALLQPKIFQPGAESKYDTHHVRKPTSLIMPEIRTIQKALSGELAKRELVRKATKFEASQPERNRQVAEQERRQDEEIRRLRKENRRLQREAYETLCSEPRWGPLLRYKNEARNENALSQDLHSASRSGRNGRSQNVDDGQDIQDIDDPFAEEEEDVVDGPRLSLFPKNNTNDSTHSRPLSEKEKETFVECMRTEHGDDRYEKAAEQLGRSIEEIFTFAKDLQEAMDRKREQGQFMERHDSWTYDIWVEKQSGSG
ncbi:hypothetical protein BKA61DRAFT_53254 [Leptodontidium sp. MPI-SDFR-AT-0119]|nr:hypothetical protein BKA61DRAFT_53254 [Leptodontidium sp. MPI-SDFR-AT-0119]